MFIPDFNNRYLRAFSIHTDAAGIDPLRDSVVDALSEIQSYSTHVVTSAERGSPDVISLNVYGDDSFWWHIMAYNGICRYNDIVEDLVLRIPDIASIISITTDSVLGLGGDAVEVTI